LIHETADLDNFLPPLALVDEGVTYYHNIFGLQRQALLCCR
jgi:hypothetical protein